MRLIAFLFLLAAPAAAETVVAARTIRAQAIITPADVTVIEKTVPGTLSLPAEAVGLEARVILYSGRPIRPGDIGPPAIIERNQIVTLIYRSGPLSIAAEARAMSRAGVGDAVRVMNLASRTTVTGIVRADGTVSVGATQFPG
ncbi:MAG: flagella basal body P-ring formation protein FlgA [Maritimibacter sp.]|nr:flagella basal body P-ring formation protein FlgA [Maritimibacter sp.]